MAYYSLIDQ